ncbi:MAG: ABC-F family ATP-binding cassette domain-containing protein [Treponema sp.]|nr:ABC-F family ATP-binding cassette domain-containing protein [Treponema sp.]
MNLLSINNLSKTGREKPLFTDVTFGLQEGEKAALIGKNGTGKSTLLNTIAGTITSDGGTIVFNKEATVSFLPQNPDYSSEDSIREHIFKHKSPKLDIINEYSRICEELSTNNSDSIQKKYEQILLKMDNNDLWNYESQISSILSTLDIKDLNQKMGTLSGGMIKKVSLAQVLVEDSKILLLDEPTNHLDIKTIYWLQNYLKETPRAVLMVTHDRYFLDEVCKNIYELSRGHLKLYNGNYSDYLEKKEKEAEIEANTERRIESVLRFERKWLLRGPCARGTKIKARIQRDEQLINREKFQQDKGYTFEVKGQRLGGKVLELHGISKSFGNNQIFSDFSYKFTKGQKIGILGNNGQGKSTFLNIITGRIKPDSGTVETGVNTKFGYYEQNPVFNDSDITVLEYIKETAEHMTLNDGTKEVSAAKFLEEFGFEGKIQHSPVSSLSGGERKRLYLVRLLLENPNFLILDEPTNDFDIFTMNLLEQFLMHFEGCLLLVSHDRYFMDKCADTLFIMEEDGSISGFVGKCSEYIEYLEEEKKAGSKEDIASGDKNITSVSAGSADKNISSSAPDSSSSATVSATTTPPARKKLSYKEQREFEALDKEIPELEKEQKELEPLMSSPDFETSRKAGERYTELTKLLEEKYARWEELAV